MAKPLSEIMFGSPRVIGHQLNKQDFYEWLLAFAEGGGGGGGDFSDEIAALSEADATLAANLASEVAARITSGNNLATALGDEEFARASGDNSLAVNLTGLVATLANVGLAPKERPGEASTFFTSTLAGAASAVAAISGGTSVTNAEGLAYRFTSTGDPKVVATRRTQPLDLGKVYLAEFAVRRAVNSADPLGDAVEFGIAWLTAAKAVISETIIQTRSVVVVDGLVTIRKTISRDQTADYTAPGTARHARAFLRIYGSGGQTDVVFLDIATAGSNTPGPQGNVGLPPAHEIDEDEFRIRWSQPDGTPGAWLDIGAMAAAEADRAEEAADIAVTAAQQVSGASKNIVQLTGDGGTAFTNAAFAGVDERNTEIFFSGTYQHKDQYSFSGSTLTFTAATPVGVPIEVVVGATTAQAFTLLSPLSVTDAHVASGAAIASDKMVYRNPDLTGLYGTPGGLGLPIPIHIRRLNGVDVVNELGCQPGYGLTPTQAFNNKLRLYYGAIAAAAIGQPLYAKQGTKIEIDSGLPLPTNCTLDMYGATIRKADNCPGTLIYANGATRNTRAGNITVNGLTIDANAQGGQGSSFYPLAMWNLSGLSLQDVTILDFWSNAIHFNDPDQEGNYALNPVTLNGTPYNLMTSPYGEQTSDRYTLTNVKTVRSGENLTWADSEATAWVGDQVVIAKVEDLRIDGLDISHGGQNGLAFFANHARIERFRGHNLGRAIYLEGGNDIQIVAPHIENIIPINNVPGTAADSYGIWLADADQTYGNRGYSPPLRVSITDPVIGTGSLPYSLSSRIRGICATGKAGLPAKGISIRGGRIGDFNQDGSSPKKAIGLSVAGFIQNLHVEGILFQNIDGTGISLSETYGAQAPALVDVSVINNTFGGVPLTIDAKAADSYNRVVLNGNNHGDGARRTPSNSTGTDYNYTAAGAGLITGVPGGQT